MQVFLEISQNSPENTCARVSFLIKLQTLGLWHRCFLVNFVNFCKNIFFAEHFWTAASKSALIILDRHLLVSVCRNLYWALSHIVLILSSLKNFLRCTIWRERLSRLALMHIHWEKDIMTKILFFFPFFVFLI